MRPFLLPSCFIILWWLADSTVVLIELDTKKQMLKVISSVFGIHKSFKVGYTLLVESKSPKVPLFEDRLPLLADTRITGAGIRFRVEVVILRDQVEDHQTNLDRQCAPVRHRGETFGVTAFSTGFPDSASKIRHATISIVNLYQWIEKYLKDQNRDSPQARMHSKDAPW